MDRNGWLEKLLSSMRDDIQEIKKDVKALQGSKHKFDGVVLAVSTIVSTAISLAVIYLKLKP